MILTGEDTNVYPNKDHLYFGVPFFISVHTSDKDGVYEAKDINLGRTTFMGLMVTTKALNGIWWDVFVSSIISVYFSLCNLWMIFRPIKIVLSKKSKAQLEEYKRL